MSTNNSTPTRKNFTIGVGLTPNATTQNALKGDIEVLSTTNKLYFHNGTINDPLVQENVTATLTNKTLTAPILNGAVADIIKFYNGVNYVSIKAPATSVANTYDIVLPPAKPSANTALVYDGTTFKWGSAGGGDSSGSNDDVLATTFRARILDTFEDDPTLSSSSINPTASTATWSSLYQYYSIQYDASKTVTVGSTTTKMILDGGSPPAYVAKIGDILVVGTESRKIIALGTINTDGGTAIPFEIESAFSVPPSASPCTVSQSVVTDELYGNSFDGAPISQAFGGASFIEYMVDYQDNNTPNVNIYVPNQAPVVAYSASSDNTTWSAKSVRPTNQTSQITAQSFNPPATALYVRFFSNATSGTGVINLLEYRAYFQKLYAGVVPYLYQAYARLNGTASQYCTTSVVGGKTQIALSWQYLNGMNSGGAYGVLDVYVNGQFIPRYVSPTMTVGAYYTEVNSNTIQLDTDYSLTPYAIQIIKRS